MERTSNIRSLPSAEALVYSTSALFCLCLCLCLELTCATWVPNFGRTILNITGSYGR
jgi:hypothetical protein